MGLFTPPPVVLCRASLLASSVFELCGSWERVAYIPSWPALGLKTTTLLGTAEGREVSLWLARDVKELSPAGPTNS